MLKSFSIVCSSLAMLCAGAFANENQEQPSIEDLIIAQEAKNEMENNPYPLDPIYTLADQPPHESDMDYAERRSKKGLSLYFHEKYDGFIHNVREHITLCNVALISGNTIHDISIYRDGRPVGNYSFFVSTPQSNQQPKAEQNAGTSNEEILLNVLRSNQDLTDIDVDGNGECRETRQAINTLDSGISYPEFNFV